MLHLFFPLWHRVMKGNSKIKWGQNPEQRWVAAMLGDTRKIFAESECHALGRTHTDVNDWSALTFHREIPHCTFPSVPLRSVGMFLWDSILATPQVLGEHRREDRSRQWKALRTIPGCQTFGRDLCRPCRLEKSSHLFQDKITMCCQVDS